MALQGTVCGKGLLLPDRHWLVAVRHDRHGVTVMPYQQTNYRNNNAMFVGVRISSVKLRHTAPASCFPGCS